MAPFAFFLGGGVTLVLRLIYQHMLSEAVDTSRTTSGNGHHTLPPNAKPYTAAHLSHKQEGPLTRDQPTFPYRTAAKNISC